MASMKAGTRVFLRSSPSNTGTVSHVSADGFTVVYDDAQRKRHQPRPRFRYRWPMAERFIAGRPAED